MLRKVALSSFLVCCAIAFSSCGRRSLKDRVIDLSGRWTMVFGNDCKGYGLKSDTLIMHADGTFDQIVIAEDGRRFETAGQHWKFSPPNSVELDQRRNFFTSQRYKELVGIPEHEDILVEFTSPPSIVFNPHSDCFYTKATEVPIRN